MKTTTWVLITLLFSPVAFADVKWEAFVSSKLKLSSKSQVSKNGFSIGDAALKLGLDKGDAKLFIDLPFNSGSNATLGDFQFAKTKAQAYASMKLMSSMELTVGQFDTIFGTEGNDSPDIQFTSHGDVTTLLLPWVHVGAIAKFGFDSWNLSLLAANNSASGDGDSFGTQGPQYGLKVDFNLGSVTPFVGFQYNTPSAGTRDWFINAGLGFDGGAFKSEAQILQAHTPGLSKGTFGVQVALHYQLLEKTTLDLRVDYLDNVLESGSSTVTVSATDIAGNIRQGMKIQTGPKIKLTDHTAIKINYGYSSYKSPTVGGVAVAADRKENVFEASFVAKL